ncbi:hypothetical protein, partial [Klebsiella pneumoniae]|uniref:hypothetical protein n=1 Tax=Klebsiella pneumoniae TaxID=573 RepID=UPI001D0DAA81
SLFLNRNPKRTRSGRQIVFFFAETPYLRRSAKNGGQRNAARIRRSPAIIPGRRDNDAAGMSERRLRASGAKYDGNYAVARSFQLSE